ncbi:hypothetical protein [Hymenobacter rubripertinctus]|uniref:hypothetical protein n=1 Tax=Hymenobacter rubripertinctus TaxID=2029981 RepID=UPI0011C37694|nr:hypothetical protein [Hymenobacter rubripertinctus]
MPGNAAPVARSSAAPLTLLPASEADFNGWLLELLPGIRAAFARPGLAKARRLVSSQHYLRRRESQGAAAAGT